MTKSESDRVDPRESTTKAMSMWSAACSAARGAGDQPSKLGSTRAGRISPLM